MNTRERFLATFRFESCPRMPRWEFAFWSGTIQRWYKEGFVGNQQDMRKQEPYGQWIPGTGQAISDSEKSLRDHNVANYFDMDKGAVAIEINYNCSLQFEESVI